MVRSLHSARIAMQGILRSKEEVTFHPVMVSAHSDYSVVISPNPESELEPPNIYTIHNEDLKDMYDIAVRITLDEYPFGDIHFAISPDIYDFDEQPFNEFAALFFEYTDNVNGVNILNPKLKAMLTDTYKIYQLTDG